MRRRALKNWNKIKVVLVVFKVFAGKVLIDSMKRQGTTDRVLPKYKMTMDEALVQYIFLPTSKYIIPWSTFTSILYIISFYNDILSLATGLYTLLVPWRKILQSTVSLVMFLDSILYFITAFRKESN